MRRLVAVILSLSLFSVHLHGADSFWKPSRGVIVDRGNTINRDIAGWWIFSEGGPGTDNAHEMINPQITFSVQNEKSAVDNFTPGDSGWALQTQSGTLGGSQKFVTNDISGTSLEISGSELTVIMKIKLNTINGFSRPFTKGAINTDWEILTNDGASDLWVRAGGFGADIFRDATTALGTDVWHTIAFTLDTDADDHSYYLDGELDATDSSAIGDLQQNGTDYRINEPANDGSQTGSEIEFIRFYNRVLSAEEIRFIYHHPYAGLKQPEDVAWSFAVEEAAVTNPPRKRRVIVIP